MTIKCADCGKFIPYDDMARGLASHYFEPSNHFGPEISEWTCNACVIEEGHRRDEQRATLGLQER